jgi:hypothetical protein
MYCCLEKAMLSRLPDTNTEILNLKLNDNQLGITIKQYLQLNKV